MLGAGLILVVSLSLGSTFKVAENVVFEKLHDVSMVRSKWIFSFFMDLRAYATFMTRLQNDLRRTDEVIQGIIDNYQQDNALNPFYLELYERQRKEMSSIRAMYRVAHQELRDVMMIQRAKARNNDKVKRAILPFVGKALRSLFGVATKSDVRKVNRQIGVLANNQEEIIHILNDTLSVVNVTQVAVHENRQAIKSLSDVVRNLDTRLTQLTEALKEYLNDLENFLVVYLQVDLLITEMREAVERALFYMDNVKIQMNQMALSHLSPTIIPPRDLKRILTSIRSLIPNYLMLPADIDDIWYYYKTLSCVTMVKDHRFITLVNLPLLDLNAQFELYQVHNIPLPYARSGMTATYTLETTTLAVNAKQTDYIILTEADLIRCGNPEAKFCTVHSALYPLTDSRLCVVALFRHDQSAIKQNCQTTVRLNALLPQAVYIPDGNWIIVSQTSMQFTVMCLNKPTYQVDTSPPIFHFQTATACEVYADNMVLPPFYHKESEYGSLRQRESLLTLQNTTRYTIWRPVDSVLNNTITDSTFETDMLPDLDDLADFPVPMDTLVDRLNQIDQPNLNKIKEKWGFGDLAGFISIPLLIACVLLTLWVIIRKKLCPSVCETMAEIQETGTAQKAGKADVENILKRGERTRQPRQGEVLETTELESRPTPLTLELK